MQRQSRFSYRCNQCGLCCRDKVIILSPYDVTRMARAAGIATGEAITRYTLQRGLILRLDPGGGCSALDGSRCTLHGGRPLACRLYPLGMERQTKGHKEKDRFVALEPAAGSAGVRGEAGTVDSFLQEQDAGPYLEALEQYANLLPVLSQRFQPLADFERLEPAEFRRRAVREALAESNYDPNPLIDALFDPDACLASGDRFVESHLRALQDMVRMERDAERIAAAAVMLAVSLGYSPAEAFVGTAAEHQPAG